MARYAGSPVFRAGARWGGVMLLFALALAAGAGIVPLHAIHHRVWIVLLVVGWVLLGLETAWLIAGRLAGPARERPSVPGVTTLGSILVLAATALGFLYSRDGGNQLVEWCGVPEFKLYILSGAQYALQSDDFLLLVESVLLTVLFACLWSFVFVRLRRWSAPSAKDTSPAMHRVIAMSLIAAAMGGISGTRYHHRLRVWDSPSGLSHVRDKGYTAVRLAPHFYDRVESPTGEVRLTFREGIYDYVAYLEEHRDVFRAEGGVVRLADGWISFRGYGLIRPGGTEIESFWSPEGKPIPPPTDFPHAFELPRARDEVDFAARPWARRLRAGWNTYVLAFDCELATASTVYASIGFASHSFRSGIPVEPPWSFGHRTTSGVLRFCVGVPFLPMVQGDAEVELSVECPVTLEIPCGTRARTTTDYPSVFLVAAEHGRRQISRVEDGRNSSSNLTMVFEPPCASAQNCSTLALSALLSARYSDRLPFPEEFGVLCVLKDGSEVPAVIRRRECGDTYSFDVACSLERIDRLRVRIRHVRDLVVFPIRDIRGIPECNRDVRDLLHLRLAKAEANHKLVESTYLSDLTGGLLAGRIHQRMGPFRNTGLSGFPIRIRNIIRSRLLHDVTVGDYLDACCRGHWYVSGDQGLVMTRFPRQTLSGKVAAALSAAS